MRCPFLVAAVLDGADVWCRTGKDIQFKSSPLDLLDDVSYIAGYIDPA